MKSYHNCLEIISKINSICMDSMVQFPNYSTIYHSVFILSLANIPKNKPPQSSWREKKLRTYLKEFEKERYIYKKTINQYGVSLYWKLTLLWPAIMFTCIVLFNYIIKCHFHTNIHFIHSTFPHEHPCFDNMKSLPSQSPGESRSSEDRSSDYSFLLSSGSQSPWPKATLRILKLSTAGMLLM